MNTFFVRLQLLSLMQIGAGSLGMIEKTHLHIPAKVIWGAFTNTLTGMLFPEPGDEQYLQVGEAVAVDGISTFFPEIDRNRMFPVIPERKWISADGKISVSFSEMEAAMLTSAASTSIAPDQMAADRGTLHATDLIRPWIADLSGKKESPLCFSGYIRLPDAVAGRELDESVIRLVFDASRIGGGRKRGWGRVRTVAVERTDEYDGLRSIRIPGGELLTADMEFSPSLRVSGEIRMLSRREYDPVSGSGHRFTPATLVWSTGSVIYDPA